MHIDFETRCRLDLKVVGAYKYSKHAEVMCLAYGEKIWFPGYREPLELLDHVEAGGLLYAWNAAFERLIWMNVMVPKFKWPQVDDKQWRCKMCEAAAMSAPLKLEQAGTFFGLDQVKDKEGKKVMMDMTKPQKKTGQFKSSPEMLKRLGEYCLQDVASEAATSEVTRPLTTFEQAVWQYDLKINSRGLPIDVPLAKAATKLWSRYCEILNTELIILTRGHIESVSEVAKMTKWICQQGVSVPSLAADVLDTTLLRDDLPDHVRRVIEIRKEGGSAAVAKFPAMLQAVEEDGRVRGVLQYHAASTGRWGGRIIQPQNLPRGVIKTDEEIEWAINRVMHQDLDSLQLYFNSAMGDVMGSLVRPTIAASPGKKFIACDFAAVEARGVAWASREKDLIEAFVSGKDVYVEMASSIYRVDPAQVTKDQRFFGKTCLAGDTLVATKSGWKKLINISLEDEVWDGIKWVRHQGLSYQGKKDVISSLGVKMTPDHGVLSKNSWVEWKDLLESSSLLRSAIDSGSSLLSGTSWTKRSLEERRGYIRSSVALVVGKEECSERTSKAGGALAAILARKLKRTLNGLGKTARSFLMTIIGAVCSTDSRLASIGVTTSPVVSLDTMGAEASTYITNGEKTERHSYVTSNRFQDGITLLSRWIESITTWGMSQATSGSAPGLSTSATNVKSRIFNFVSKPWNKKSKSLEKNCDVYDLLNCGDLHRFTVLSDAGPLVVHNCILGAGYGLGAKGFQNQCAGQGVEVDGEFAKKAIDAYRSKYRNVPRLWRALEEATIGCVKTGQPSQAGPFRFRLEPDWLIAKLPSGRDLFYYKPHLRDGKYGPELRYIGLDIAKRPRIEATYGGKLLENLVQALCRDILVFCMAKLEKAGYPVVLHVHDEAVVEVDENFGSASEVQQIMSEVPPWAKGFPLAAVAEEMKRYKK